MNPHISSRVLLTIFAVFTFYIIIAMGLAVGKPSIFVTSPLGYTFNSMAMNLLDGRFDVDPNTIGYEAFISNGKSYAYFGILPAILRIPLVPFIDLRTVQVEGPIRFAAMLMSTSGSIAMVLATLRAMTAERGTDFAKFQLLVAACFSGPTVMLAMRPGIYQEVVLLAWAFTCWFLALLIPMLRAPAHATVGRLAAMAVLAGACLLTRASTGIGLLLALAAVMLVLMTQEMRASWRAGPRKVLAIPFRASLVAPTLIAVAFIIAAGGVNYARWGNPFVFADLRLQAIWLAEDPYRIERIETYGHFNLERLKYGLLYYFFPIWSLQHGDDYILPNDIYRLIDVFELPHTSLLLTDPLTTLLAAVGLSSLIRAKVPAVSPSLTGAALAGLAVPACMMLIAWSMSFRYRVEFMPFLTLAACVGTIRLSAWLNDAPVRRVKRARMGLIALLALQVASANFHAIWFATSRG